MTTLLDRFLRYVKIDTQADEQGESYPSTKKQLDLSRLLVEECRALGLSDVNMDEHGIVMATIPPNVKHTAPTIAWMAHVDTSPETSGTNVKPIVHENYAGGDIKLPGDPDKVIRVEDNPELNDLKGATIITSDGTTLLGADDKAGITAIMTAAQRLMEDSSLPRGPIRLCFTCDEEVGRGVVKLDLKKINATCAYTLDGAGQGMVDCETFSADQAIVTVRGVNIHPSIGKGRLVNAIRILGAFVARLPVEGAAPETTDDREGFMHPYVVEGGVAEASVRILLRDFETEKLTAWAAQLERIAGELRAAHPKASIDVTIKKQYRNMREGLEKEPRALALALEATRMAGLEPKQTIVRGGTDGSGLTEMGLPTPNLSTGEHNPHSPLEWTSLEEMTKASEVLVQLAGLWSREKA